MPADPHRRPRRRGYRLHEPVGTPRCLTVAVFVIIAVAIVRRLNPMWILVVPILGGVAVGVCLVIAGHRADHAAISVETPAPASAAST